nr:hypothetical protein Iba_chr02aCG17120 [Ipomoea batatas]
MSKENDDWQFQKQEIKSLQHLMVSFPAVRSNYLVIYNYMKNYLSLISDIDNDGIRNYGDSEPLTVFQDLKPFNIFVLKQESEDCAIRVWLHTENKIRARAWGIEVEPCYLGCSISISKLVHKAVLLQDLQARDCTLSALQGSHIISSSAIFLLLLHWKSKEAFADFANFVKEII